MAAASSWLPPTNIGSTGELFTAFKLPPDVAIGPTGETTAVWTANPPGGDSAILTASRPAGGAWGPEEEISAGMGLEPEVAYGDRTGEAIAIWPGMNEFGGIVLRAAAKPAGGTWGAPVDVSEPDVGGARRIAIGPEGEATAIWVATNGTVQRIEAASRPPGGDWGAPVEISGATIGPDAPDLAIDGAGEVTAVWESGGAIQSASRMAGGAWGQPQELSSPGLAARQPSIAVDPAGDATVVWTSQEQPSEEFVIQATSRLAGGAWGPVVDLSDPLEEEALAEVVVDGAGEATAVWPGEEASGPGNDVEAAARPLGGTWQSPVELVPGGVLGEVDVAVASAGQVTAIWTQEEPEAGGALKSYVAAATRSDDGVWGQPVPLSSTSEVPEVPSIDLDQAGDGAAVWSLVGESKGEAVGLIQAAGFDGSGPPLSATSIPTTATVGVPVNFTTDALDVWSAVAGVSWSFGDGATAAGTAVTHTYVDPGSYEVSVEATDALGQTNKASGTIVVAPGPAKGSSAPTPSAPPTATAPSAPPRRVPTIALRFVKKGSHRRDSKAAPRYIFRFRDPTGESRFSCRLDRGPFHRCGSPAVYRHLRPGRHVFRVRAETPDGSVSPVRVVRFRAVARR